MVQSKKKQKKNSDFSKVKLKVGKAKPAASNATTIELKSRTLVVPGQALTTDKTDVAKTRRNLTLKELLSHLRHHNAVVRKEALAGISELMDAHDTLLYQHLGTIMEALVPTMNDESPSVRTALLTHMKRVLSSLDSQHIHPFVALFMMYLTSAMTHIFEDIRVDALRFLDLWIEQCPHLLLPHTSQILANYVGMLAGADGKSDDLVVAANPNGKLSKARVRLTVFYSLARFLNLVREHQASASPKSMPPHLTGMLSPMGDAMTSGALWHILPPTAPVTAELPFNLFQMGSEATSSHNATYSLHDPASVRALIDAVTPAVLAFWMESAGPVLSKAQVVAGDNLDVCAAAVQLLSTLFRFLAPDGAVEHEADDGTTAQTWLATYRAKTLRHMAPMFPFGAGKQCDARVRSTLMEMNLHFVEVLARVDPSNMAVAMAYMKRTFTIAAAAGTDAKAAAAPAMNLTAEQFAVVVPALDACLRISDSLLDRMLDWCHRLPMTHPTRAIATRYLVVKLMGKNPKDIKSTDLVRTFTLGLVRYIWELKLDSPETTTRVLEYLRHALCARLCMTATLRTQLANGLAAFFSVATKKGVLYGPFLQASESIQTMVLDTVRYLEKDITEALVKAIVRCLLVPTVSMLVVSRALYLFQAHLTPALFVSTLLTVGIGAMLEDLASLDRVMDVADYVHHRLVTTGLAQRTRGKRKSTSARRDDTESIDAEIVPDAAAYVVRQQAIQESVRLFLRQPGMPPARELAQAVEAALEPMVDAAVGGKLPVPVSLWVATLVHGTRSSALKDGDEVEKGEGEPEKGGEGSDAVRKCLAVVEKTISESDAPERHPLFTVARDLLAALRE
ncbi:Testis-expressed sequence 10 protein [Allomyces javanicus]|nr:Testis-expressed sequence 10 protein [Allomyces javanicus]